MLNFILYVRVGRSLSFHITTPFGLIKLTFFNSRIFLISIFLLISVKVELRAPTANLRAARSCILRRIMLHIYAALGYLIGCISGIKLNVRLLIRRFTLKVLLFFRGFYCLKFIFNMYLV
jgi:hypothetical protein